MGGGLTAGWLWGGVTWTVKVWWMPWRRRSPVLLSQSSLCSWPRWQANTGCSPTRTCDVTCGGGGELWKCLERPCRSGGALWRPQPTQGQKEEGGVQQTRLNNTLMCTCMASGITLNHPERVSNMWYCSGVQYDDWERGKPEILLLRLCYCSVNEGERCIYVSGRLCSMGPGCSTSAEFTKYILVTQTALTKYVINVVVQNEGLCWIAMMSLFHVFFELHLAYLFHWAVTG